MEEGGFLPDETGMPSNTPVNNNFAPNYHNPNGTQTLSRRRGLVFATRHWVSHLRHGAHRREIREVLPRRAVRHGTGGRRHD